jgi:RNA recognition motif-containing protein
MQANDLALPNQTIYIQNLNEKIKIEELKKALYHVFSQFGNILEIHANKRLKTKGQAWVIFDDVSAATKAVREMQGFNFYTKAMKVHFSKVKSDVVAKIDGSFIARPKRKQESEHKVPKKTKAAPAQPLRAAAPTVIDGDAVMQAALPVPVPIVLAPQVVAAAPTPPNKILFVENLPPQCSAMMLAMLFQQYNGYKEARLVPGKPGIAFVEFTDAFQSAAAKEALQGFKITPTQLMRITFAKQ